MKIILILISLIQFFWLPLSYSQSIEGQWNGALQSMGQQIRIIIHVEKTLDGFKGTMDSPDQKVAGIPLSSTTYNNDTLIFTLDVAKIKYVGSINEKKELEGVFNQAGQAYALTFSREPIAKKINVRPQEPKAPFPYKEEEVTFRNKKDDITLAGTLSLPNSIKNPPVIVLITGSGPQDRNEELLGHKPFLVLSDHLVRNGFAVLRYDDRGFGASTGNFSSATSEDFAHDALSAVKFLCKRKDINRKKIGLIGHSEGGIIAPMVAVQSKDVAFIGLLAGTGIPGDELLTTQIKLIELANGGDEEEIEKASLVNKILFNMVKNSTDPNRLKKELTDTLQNFIKEEGANAIPEGLTEEEFIATTISSITSPWMTYFFKHDPAEVLEKVKCPVLAINGEKDLQVPMDINLDAIESALKKGGNNTVEIVRLKGMNHLFQECNTGSPNEYGEIEQTFSPKALNVISDWLIRITK